MNRVAVATGTPSPSDKGNPVIRLLIHSDLACPFCYLAESTLGQLSARWNFSLDWLAFELHPEIPPGGFDLRGTTPDRASQLYDRALWTAATLKIPLNPPGVIPNSRLGLAAIIALTANDPPAARTLRMRLFEACYVQDLPISTGPEVLDIAKSVLNHQQLETVQGAITGQTPARLVHESKEKGFEALVSGVPVIRFFANEEERRDLRIMGAQPPEIFERVFEALEVPAS